MALLECAVRGPQARN